MNSHHVTKERCLTQGSNETSIRNEVTRRNDDTHDVVTREFDAIHAKIRNSLPSKVRNCGHSRRVHPKASLPNS